jgi:hypothetical protein
MLVKKHSFKDKKQQRIVVGKRLGKGQRPERRAGIRLKSWPIRF